MNTEQQETQMSDDKPHQRAMDDASLVARTIFAHRRHHEPVHSWNDLYEDEKASYRAMAVAVIDSLGLTEELHTYEETETKAVMGGEGAMRHSGQTITPLGWRTDRPAREPVDESRSIHLTYPRFQSSTKGGKHE